MAEGLVGIGSNQILAPPDVSIWVGISRRGTVVAYLVPAEVVEMFEDEMDRRAAEEISDRVERGEEETISLEEAAKELGVELPE